MSGAWFRDLAESGRLPLFWFFIGVVCGFLFIRLSVRMIRAKVRWWPGNVNPSGLHIHHVVFGVVFMLVGGVAGLLIPNEELFWSSVVAFVFGVGAALVLDEFALILHLDDVYWQERGRTSIDAVFVAVAVTGMLVLGLRPVILEGLTGIGGVLLGAFHLGLAVITVLKGKIWTGLVGLFVPVLLYVGAIRLARPSSPWSRWRYARPDLRARSKLERATWREQRLRNPMIRAKVRLQDLVAGRHDLPPS
ncbi:integral membrane protein [Rhizocola hellebori]|uniref:Integral membrane protein n=1 Tax=Rhizocola hellebori TaxID=1392758 RepID=A0A8J3VLD0_9ACTN|nr:hypothetical protein [Rhizocola hellebori]GIH09881.1 integral membrane protein [Rhizocola hellebori]